MTFTPRTRVPDCLAVPTGGGLEWLAPREHTQPGRRLRGSEERPEGRGPEVSVHDRHMDEVAIRAVTAGQRRLASLTFAERHEAIRRLLLRRMSVDTIARHVGTPTPTVAMYVRWVLHGCWISPNYPAEVIEAMVAEYLAHRAA